MQSTGREIAEDIIKDLNFPFLNVGISFFLNISRVTPTFGEAHYNMSCKYSTIYQRKKYTDIMTISLPIRVKDVGIMMGKLSYSLTNPDNLYFEDMLDHVQRTLGETVYPIASLSDKETLRTTFDESKFPYEHITDLRDSSIEKELSKGGEIVITVDDIYSMYHFIYGVDW